MKENNFEKNREKIPTKDEVLEVISRFAERTTFVKELSNKEGLYYLEVTAKGNQPGETLSYMYARKGRFGGNNESSATSISVTYYQDGNMISGEELAEYDPSTGKWRDLPR